MLRFKHFIIENKEEEGSKLKHLTHVEDKAFEGSHGTSSAISAINEAHNYIKNGQSGPKLTMKYDGSPSIVYGHHPETGKFFVASKSAFNKNPKINYTSEDIDRNHGHAPGLAEKLKDALHHLPKVAPKRGVYQGDLMFSGNDVKHKDDGSASFTPNTISYTARGDEADKIKRAKVGVVTHTQYHGNSIASMTADPNPDHHNFAHHPDVYGKSPEHDTKNVHYSESAQTEFNTHLSAAKKLHDTHKNTMYEATEPHSGDSGHLATYINHTVRTGEKPTAQGLKSHIAGKYQKAIDKLKTTASQARKNTELQSHLDHIDGNSEHYNNLLKLHHHLQKAKDVLVNTLNQHEGGLEHHISGNRTDPEGFVFHPTKSKDTDGAPIKLVNRAEFSKANLLKVR
jgi:hypothetical protein